MFGFEFSHLLLLAAIALIVLGPNDMPKLARILGKTIGELKKAVSEATSQMTAEVEDTKPPLPPLPQQEDPTKKEKS